MSGNGKVYSFVVYHRVYHPAFKDKVPYVVAVVELDEGPRIISNVVDLPIADVTCEMPVRGRVRRPARRVPHPEIRAALVSGALDGVSVLEIANYVSGPYAGMLLADLGATVIKIEGPNGGDPFRGWGTVEYSATFGSLNRNKKSVVLDLKNAGDLETAARTHRRCGRADPELPARHARTERPRLRRRPPAQPASGLRVDHRLRQ